MDHRHRRGQGHARRAGAVLNLRRQAAQYFLSLPEQSEADLNTVVMATKSVFAADAQCFLLPENGYLLGVDQPICVPISEVHLPFPVVSLEYSGHAGSGDIPAGHFKPERTVIHLEQVDGSIGMCVCWKSGEMWTPILSHLVFPSDGHIEVTADRDVRAKVEFATIRGVGNPQPVSDFLNETSIVGQFLLFLNCANVRPRLAISPSEKLQQSARKRGNLPFDSYWILDLGHDETDAKGSGTSSHASPRMHFRRGHIRRLPTGKTTFVRACKVGNAEHGVVFKDYRLQ